MQGNLRVFRVTRRFSDILPPMVPENPTSNVSQKLSHPGLTGDPKPHIGPNVPIVKYTVGSFRGFGHLIIH